MAFKKTQTIVGLASSTSPVSVDLLLASVMRLGRGCQTWGVTEMSLAGGAEARLIGEPMVKLPDCPVSMPLGEHKKHRLLCKISRN